jgi:hypothetical protein
VWESSWRSVHWERAANVPDAQRFRGLGLATATTSAAFLPHFEHRIRSASCLRVTDQPTRRASASGSISRIAPPPVNRSVQANTAVNAKVQARGVQQWSKPPEALGATRPIEVQERPENNGHSTRGYG